MNPLKSAVNYVADKLDRLMTAVFGTAGGLLLAQFPQFLAQYIQRLGGHIDEAILSAKKYNLPDISQRAEELKAGLYAITDAPQLFKLPKFVIHADWGIAAEAFKNFTPGMTFNEQGLYYLGAGVLIGILIYGILKFLLDKVFNAMFSGKEKKGNPATPTSGRTVI
ncbi:MAG: DUF2937 family protein [Spirochaetes bacterium]|nr:DUF2937 family protein [Spirochaetota bacterium]